MDVSASTLRWQRWLVLVTLVASALLVWWWGGDDNFALPKATFLVLAALGLLWCAALRWSWSRRIVVPRSAPLVAAGLFTLGLLISTITSTSRLQSVVGQYQQYDGLVTYLACVVVFIAAMRSFRPEHVVWLLRAFVVAMLGVAGLALVEMAGLAPARLWNTSAVVSTLGNQNFTAGWLAIAIGPCIVLAALAEEPLLWRVAAAVGAVAGAIALVGANSFQGPMAGGVAIVLAVVAVVLVRRPLARLWTGRNLLLATGAVVVVAAAAGVVGWSFIHRSLDEGMYDRRAFWSAAVHVIEDHPLVGTGPDTFHNQYLQRMPVGHTGANAGAVHNVPLDLLANGGLVTGLPYLAFLVLTFLALLRLVRRARGSDLLVMAGLGTAWAGYVVQSIVSIDRPGLVATHWVVAGVIAGLAVTRDPIVLTLPGALEGRRLARQGAGWLVPAGLATVLAVGAIVPLTRPIRAAVAVAAANDALGRNDVTKAISQAEHAMALAPWEPHHTYTATRAYAFGNRPADVVAAAGKGARLAPGDASYAIFAAEACLAAGDEGCSAHWWKEAVQRDPNGPATMYNAGLAAGRRGDRAEIERLIPMMKRLDLVQGWGAAGEWYAALGDKPMARAAYDEALRLHPGDAGAIRGLSKLDK